MLNVFQLEYGSTICIATREIPFFSLSHGNASVTQIGSEGIAPQGEHIQQEKTSRGLKPLLTLLKTKQKNNLC